MKETVAHLQAVYNTTLFYQTNVTRAQVRQAAKAKAQPTGTPETGSVSQPPAIDPITPNAKPLAIPT